MQIKDFVTATSIADNDFLAMADASGNTKKVAKSTLVPLVNNLTSTTTGSALDSAQGKVLDDKITTNTNDINILKDEVNKTSLTNIEIGESPITTLTGMLDGFVDSLVFKGKTKYKTSGGTYTDTYASGVTIESTGEVEGKMIMTSLKPDNTVGDTLNATVSKPLRSQGTVKDIYNVTNKTITRNIGQMTFKGVSTETWVLGTPPLSTNTLQFKIQIADGKIGLSATDVNIMCDKFIPDTSANNISNDAEGIAFDDNGYVLVRILKSKLATQDVAGFKLWLASVNTTIVYQLLNPITETIKKQGTLQTFEGGYLQLENVIVPTVNFNYPTKLASIVSEHTRAIDELEDVVVENSDKIGVLTTDLSDKANDTDSSRTTTNKTVTGAINELNTSLVDILKHKYLRATTSGYTSVPGDGTPSKIIFDTPVTVSDANLYNLNNGNIKVLTGGSYSISTSIVYPANASGLRSVLIKISKDNGTTWVSTVAFQQTNATSSYNAILSISSTVELSANDIVAIFTNQSSGVSLSVADGGYGLHIVKVRG